MRRSLLVLFAIASGFAVGNLYFVQPLLARISQDLGTSTVHNGWLVTSVQLGYITGIMFLLPLGDVLNRKKFVPIMMTIAGLAQISIGQSTNFTWLAISFICVGFSTIAGQILIPLTTELSEPEHRARNSSFVVSGMIIGILAARTVSGSLSDLISWHGTFTVIGLANIVLAWTLYSNIPALAKRESIRYPKLVIGIFSLLKKNPWVLRVMLTNAISMAVFSATWTSITFLLSAEPFSWSTTQIGLVGLVGIVSATSATFTGRFIDKGYGDRNSTIAFAVSAVAMAIGSFAPISLVFLLISLILREFSGQTIGIHNQTQLIAMFPHARSRVNAGYVAINFIGQAIGTTIAVTFYPMLGWSGVQWICCGLSTFGLLFWIFNLRTKPAQPVF